MTSQKPSFLLGSGGDLLAKNYIDTFSEVKKLPKQFVAGGWPSQIDFDTFYFGGKNKSEKFARIAQSWNLTIPSLTAGV